MNNTLETNVIIRAKCLAREVHAGMCVRTVSGDTKPQLEHLQEVADLVWAGGGSDIEIASAWLHDSVEDTETTVEEIQEKFGEIIAEIVHGLTDTDVMKGLPMLERKKSQALKIATQNDSAKTIKIADQISNVRLMAIDPIDTWSKDDIQEYVKGAMLIVNQCRGVNVHLEKLFDVEYERAILVLNHCSVRE